VITVAKTNDGTRELHFTKEKETKNTVKFEEQPKPGQPPIIGSLYVQKWAAGTATEVEMTMRLA